MMDMKRAMGPCRLRPDRPPIAHSFTRPFVQKPLAAGDSHRALPVVGYHARMLHSSRAVSVRSISSVRGEEFVTLPGADSDSGCKLIHLTEGTGADKLLVYLPGGGTGRSMLPVRSGKAVKARAAEPLPHAWGSLTVCTWSGTQAVRRVCVPCVCGGGGPWHASVPRSHGLSTACTLMMRNLLPMRLGHWGCPPYLRAQARSNPPTVSPITLCCLKKRYRGLSHHLPDATHPTPHLPYQLTFVSPLVSPTGTDGTGQSILLQLPQLEEAGWDVWTLYIPVEVRPRRCTFRHYNARYDKM